MRKYLTDLGISLPFLSLLPVYNILFLISSLDVCYSKPFFLLLSQISNCATAQALVLKCLLFYVCANVLSVVVLHGHMVLTSPCCSPHIYTFSLKVQPEH